MIRSNCFYISRSLFSTSSLIDSAKQQHRDWDAELDNLLVDGNVFGAKHLFEKIMEKTANEGMLDEAWILGLRTKLFDAWLRHQDLLLKKLEQIQVPAGEAEVTSTANELRLVQQIYKAANEAHEMLEVMEPFLGARNVWLDTRSSVDVEDHEYHGKLLADADRSKSEIHSSNDTLLLRCNNLLAAWSRAVRADRNKAGGGIPQRATFLLERMEATSSVEGKESTTPISVPPTLESYNRVLEAWAYSREHLRGATAERILDRMGRHQTSSLLPNGESHRLVMWAWAQSPHEDRFAFLATGHLLKMLYSLEDSLENNTNAYDHTREPTLEDYSVIEL